MIIASEQPFNGPAIDRLTGGHCEAIVTYTFFSKSLGRLRSAVA
jgi:hypothetical protein